jgi:hypothetical protein
LTEDAGEERSQTPETDKGSGGLGGLAVASKLKAKAKAASDTEAVDGTGSATPGKKGGLPTKSAINKVGRMPGSGQKGPSPKKKAAMVESDDSSAPTKGQGQRSAKGASSDEYSLDNGKEAFVFDASTLPPGTGKAGAKGKAKSKGEASSKSKGKAKSKSKSGWNSTPGAKRGGGTETE